MLSFLLSIPSSQVKGELVFPAERLNDYKQCSPIPCNEQTNPDERQFRCKSSTPDICTLLHVNTTLDPPRFVEHKACADELPAIPQQCLLYTNADVLNVQLVPVPVWGSECRCRGAGAGVSGSVLPVLLVLAVLFALLVLAVLAVLPVLFALRVLAVLAVLLVLIVLVALIASQFEAYPLQHLSQSQDYMEYASVLYDENSVLQVPGIGMWTGPSDMITNSYLNEGVFTMENVRLLEGLSMQGSDTTEADLNVTDVANSATELSWDEGTHTSFKQQEVERDALCWSKTTPFQVSAGQSKRIVWANGSSLNPSKHVRFI
eukprot:g17044.t1